MKMQFIISHRRNIWICSKPIPKNIKYNSVDGVRMQYLLEELHQLMATGRKVALVTSGAVGAGMGALGNAKRPNDLAELQACAAVGQSRLMATYEKLFAKHNLTVAQVLLTHDDLQHHERHLNARNTRNAPMADVSRRLNLEIEDRADALRLALRRQLVEKRRRVPGGADDERNVILDRSRRNLRRRVADNSPRALPTDAGPV
jgi:hypothetical protein